MNTNKHGSALILTMVMVAVVNAQQTSNTTQRLVITDWQ